MKQVNLRIIFAKKKKERRERVNLRINTINFGVLKMCSLMKTCSFIVYILSFLHQQGCEREVAEAQKGSSDELVSECIMRLSWALVHSRHSVDVQRGIAMLEGEQTSDMCSLYICLSVWFSLVTFRFEMRTFNY